MDCTNIALKGGKTGANSCGWTSATPPGWQLVEPGNAKGGEFHYDVSTAGINSQGVVQVTSTGQVNGVTRTIQVNVGRGGSTDFLYYTDFEDADPDNQTAYPYGASTQCGEMGRRTPSTGGRAGDPAALRSPSSPAMSWTVRCTSMTRR